jgi:glycine hydroxymethyltransferase
MNRASQREGAPALSRRDWPPADTEQMIETIAAGIVRASASDVAQRIEALGRRNREIHEVECVNLNPATNVMNPKAEAMMAAGLGSRPSLGYPGDKYEMGLEAIEEIEIIAAELAGEIFQATHAEIRAASGAMANLFAFMAMAKPGDSIIVPPPSIGGHVTHQRPGAAGLYGLSIHAAPIDPSGYTVDLDGLRRLAMTVRPTLITIGGSLNLFPHPVAEIRRIADEVGAGLLFDAAHLCGPIAGKAWPNPLNEGAHLMTMSTYKSLGGPAGGLVVTNDAAIAKRLDEIAYPGLTANFDAGRVAALAMSLLDWRVHGTAYAKRMIENAQALAGALAAHGLAVQAAECGFTSSHQFALVATDFGGGQAAAKRLRRANILSCGIGLPLAPIAGDVNGLRLGTPEITRWGMAPKDMPILADLIARGLRADDPATIAAETTAMRRGFRNLHFVA